MAMITEHTMAKFLQDISLVEYITMFGSITDQNPDNDTYKERIPFDLWPRQEYVCYNIERALRALLPKSRQKGYSEIAAERCLKTLFSNKRVKGAVVSKSEDFAKEFLSSRIVPKYEEMCLNFPNVFPKIVRQTKEEIEWEGGRVLKSISCSNTGAASLTLDFMVFDEAGGIDENKGATGENSLFRSILDNSLPALDQNKNAWVMIIGTSVPGTYYNQLVREAHDKQNKGVFKYFFIGWHHQPGRDIEWYRDQHEQLKDNVFLQHPTDMDDFFYIKDGLVFQHFDPQEGGRHVLDFSMGKKFLRKSKGRIERLKASWNMNYITSYDHGTSHPAVNLYGIYDQYKDVLFIIAETFFQDGHGATVGEIALSIKQKLSDLGGKQPNKQIADGAIYNNIGAQSVGDIFYKGYGLKFKKAKKHDEAASRELVNERFRNNKIVIHKDCINLIDQVRGYRWDAKSRGEKPIQHDDDAIDALRYMCAECKKGAWDVQPPLPDVYERRGRKAMTSGNDPLVGNTNYGVQEMNNDWMSL